MPRDDSGRGLRSSAAVRYDRPWWSFKEGLTWGRGRGHGRKLYPAVCVYLWLLRADAWGTSAGHFPGRPAGGCFGPCAPPDRTFTAIQCVRLKPRSERVEQQKQVCAQRPAAASLETNVHVHVFASHPLLTQKRSLECSDVRAALMVCCNG